MSVLLYVESM